MKLFVDLENLPEDARVEVIGRRAMAATGSTVFMVEDDAKADRYVKKMIGKFPALREYHRGPGPIPDSVQVAVGRTNEN